MDVESQKTIDEAIDRLTTAFRAALATTVVDAEQLLNRLDGWHLTITPQGPISAITGAIVVELTAPKKEHQS